MQRRILLSSVVGLLAAGGVSRAGAAGFSSGEAGQALRAALERGAQAAVLQLGRAGGFSADERLRIRLPEPLEQAAPLLQSLGQGKRLDELRAAMNQAAEQAVPMALPLLKSAIRGMSVNDARGILLGSDSSVTEFFEGKTREPLTGKFLPIVSKVTDRLTLTRRYNDLAAKAAGMGLLKGDQASVQQYVTAKALDGLYVVIADEERSIRHDPVGTGSAILKKVFGAL